MAAFNLLQDMRHLVIIDLRQQFDFELGHIRRSIRADLTTYARVLVDNLLTPTKQFASHYEGDDLRRVLFVLPNDQATEMDKKIKAEMEAIAANLQTVTKGLLSLHKAFWVKDFPKF